MVASITLRCKGAEESASTSSQQPGEGPFQACRSVPIKPAAVAEDDPLRVPGNQLRNGLFRLLLAKADDKAQVGRGLAVGCVDTGEPGKEAGAQ